MTNNRTHFEISERKVLLRIIDITVVLVGVFLVSLLFKPSYFIDITSEPLHLVVLGMYISLLGSVFDVYDLNLYKHGIVPISKRLILVALSVFVLNLSTPIITPSLPENRLQYFYFLLAILVPLLLWRWSYLLLFNKGYSLNKKSVIIYGNDSLQKLILPLQELDPSQKIIGCFNIEENNPYRSHEGISSIKDLSDLEAFISEKGVYEIIIGPNVNISSMDSLLLKFLENGVMIKDYVNAYETNTKKIPVSLISKEFYRYFPFSRSNNNNLYLAFLRLEDIVFSLVGLFCTVLLLPLILLGNLIGNRGPLFYKQERVGKRGQLFNIIKFRTMRSDAEKDGAKFAQKNDMRITSFGGFLRRTRIDELPQLINILKGEMAIIGPRPERPVFVEKITDEMPLYPVRHAIKPGLTGWAQVSYRYGASIEDSIEKLRYDLYYIKHRNIILDGKIILKTIGAVLFFRGR